jgi:hypothetical protein
MVIIKMARFLTLTLLLVLIGCSSFEVPGNEQLFPRGAPFVVKGTAGLVFSNRPCPVWYGDNGVSYHLFQGQRVDNDEFDLVVTPGVRSRLEIAVRTDIFLDCQVGVIAEVENILEIES